MLARCIGMGVEMPVAPADVDGIFRLRDKELPRWLDVDFGTSTIMFPKTSYVTLTTNLPRYVRVFSARQRTQLGRWKQSFQGLPSRRVGQLGRSHGVPEEERVPIQLTGNDGRSCHPQLRPGSSAVLGFTCQLVRQLRYV